MLTSDFMSSDKLDPGINNTARSQPGERSGNNGDNLQPGLQRKTMATVEILGPAVNN